MKTGRREDRGEERLFGSIGSASAASESAARRDGEPGEAELIGKAAAGEMDAFAELARRKRPLVHRLAARICGPLEADDVSQVVLLLLWKNMPLLAREGKIDAWLRRVTVNRSIDAYRHIGRRLRLIDASRREQSQPTLEELLRRGEISRVFNAVAEGLGERQRAAFVLREFEGLDSGEVASLMGIKPSTVRNLVMQARQELRRALRERFPEYAPGN